MAANELDVAVEAQGRRQIGVVIGGLAALVPLASGAPRGRDQDRTAMADRCPMPMRCRRHADVRRRGALVRTDLRGHEHGRSEAEPNFAALHEFSSGRVKAVAGASLERLKTTSVLRDLAI